MDAYKVGGETESWCTHCKQIKDHVIVALLGGKPAKVQCMGCQKQHQFRVGRPGAGAGTARPRKTSTTAPEVAKVDLATRLAGKTARDYAPALRFAVDDAVRHPQFGVGIVVAHPGPGKIDVEFPIGRKVLLHERAPAQPSSMPTRPGPREEGLAGTSDAPIRKG